MLETRWMRVLHFFESLVVSFRTSIVLSQYSGTKKNLRAKKNVQLKKIGVFH